MVGFWQGAALAGFVQLNPEFRKSLVHSGFPICLVIDLELPWNPLRIEQRVGRVDRLGQERPVHALHLFHRGTVEDRVLANLERRRIVASRSMGDAE